MSTKMVKCKSCGNDIAASAKACPNCGAKNSKPLYKRCWFWLLIIIGFFMIIAGIGSSGDDDTTSSVPTDNTEAVTEAPIVVSADDLLKAYMSNSVSADATYKGKTVTVSGTIFSIENGYVQVEADSSDLWFHYVLAYYSNSEKEKLGNLSKGDRITFTGECKGESWSGSTIIEVKYCTIN